MVEERIYLTQDDIPQLDTPCYITNYGEVYQYSRREKKIVKRKVNLEREYNYCRVTLSLVRGAPHYTTSVCLPSLIYRLFSGEENLPDRLYINYRDGNAMNCRIDNLYRTKKYMGEYHPTRIYYPKKELDNYGLQKDINSLTLYDLPSVICFLQLKQQYKHKNIAVTELIIDTSNWCDDDLNQLSKFKHLDGVTIQ